MAGITFLVTGLAARCYVAFIIVPRKPGGGGPWSYATLAARETGRDEPWVVGTLVITASLLAYGLTATPLSRWYGRLRRQRGGAPA